MYVVLLIDAAFNHCILVGKEPETLLLPRLWEQADAKHVKAAQPRRPHRSVPLGFGTSSNKTVGVMPSQCRSCSRLKTWGLADAYHRDECSDIIARTAFEFASVASLIESQSSTPGLCNLAERTVLNYRESFSRFPISGPFPPNTLHQAICHL